MPKLSQNQHPSKNKIVLFVTVSMLVEPPGNRRQPALKSVQVTLDFGASGNESLGAGCGANNLTVEFSDAPRCGDPRGTHSRNVLLLTASCC